MRLFEIAPSHRPLVSLRLSRTGRMLELELLTSPFRLSEVARSRPLVSLRLSRTVLELVLLASSLRWSEVAQSCPLVSLGHSVVAIQALDLRYET
jgi:hypothetical protein